MNAPEAHKNVWDGFMPSRKWAGVNPAQAVVQKGLKILDSRIRRNDMKQRFRTSYKAINFQSFEFYYVF